MDHGPRLPRSFFRADPRLVARRLLGQSLVRILDDGTRLSGLIVEAEAYLGVRDRAAHTFAGRRTPRNESMYADGGAAYVYFTYGMHHCFNVVCGEADEPVAVLIRALEPVEGIEAMRRNRSTGRRAVGEYDLCSGPAKLCQAFAVGRDLNAEDLTQSKRMWLERGLTLHPKEIAVGPRIGVDYAGIWAKRRLRFWIKGNQHVSR